MLACYLRMRMKRRKGRRSVRRPVRADGFRGLWSGRLRPVVRALNQENDEGVGPEFPLSGQPMAQTAVPFQCPVQCFGLSNWLLMNTLFLNDEFLLSAPLESRMA